MSFRIEIIFIYNLLIFNLIIIMEGFYEKELSLFDHVVGGHHPFYIEKGKEEVLYKPF